MLANNRRVRWLSASSPAQGGPETGGAIAYPVNAKGSLREIHAAQEVLEGGGRSAPLADPVAPTQVSHHLAASRGLQNFFASTSCSMTLSNVRSATNRFSRWFSSCNCFSWRT